MSLSTARHADKFDLNRLMEALTKIGFESISQKPDRGHPVPPAGEARSRLAELIFRNVIRSVRSGGQDVRDPFLKIEELVQSFLISVFFPTAFAETSALDRKSHQPRVLSAE